MFLPKGRSAENEVVSIDYYHKAQSGPQLKLINVYGSEKYMLHKERDYYNTKR
jgi:hypothetical protein